LLTTEGTEKTRHTAFLEGLEQRQGRTGNDRVRKILQELASWFSASV
jgi:hypothetical protein